MAVLSSAAARVGAWDDTLKFNKPTDPRCLDAQPNAAHRALATFCLPETLSRVAPSLDRPAPDYAEHGRPLLPRTLVLLARRQGGRREVHRRNARLHLRDPLHLV